MEFLIPKHYLITWLGDHVAVFWFLFNVHILQHHLKGLSKIHQFLTICLTMKGTRVHALVQDDPTFRGATKPASYNY